MLRDPEAGYDSSGPNAPARCVTNRDDASWGCECLQVFRTAGPIAELTRDLNH